MVGQLLLGRGFTITLRHHTQQDSSGRMISKTQRPLPDYTQHSKIEKSMHPVEIEPVIPTSERPQNNALDRAATRISYPIFAPLKSAKLSVI